MYVFKEIDKSDVSLEENSLYTKQTLTTSSLGITSIQYRSGSSIEGGLSGYGKFDRTISGSHWDFLNYTFYMSGSSTVNTDEANKFNSPFYSALYLDPVNPQHRNKFYSSGSVFYIPDYYIGERIERGTFTLSNLTYSSSIDNTIQPIIKDDGYGNLYSTNAYHSQSSATSISSSENYVGNIMYEYGVIALTETGSWSGSVTYADFGSSTDNYNIDFVSRHTSYTLRIKAKIRPEEFNHTLNLTARGVTSGSWEHKLELSPYFMPTTGSRFNPYVTSLEFYDRPNAADSPLVVANISKAIEKIDDTHFIFEVTVDF